MHILQTNCNSNEKQNSNQRYFEHSIHIHYGMFIHFRYEISHVIQ